MRGATFASVAPSERVTPMNAANLCPEPTARIESLNELHLEYNLDISQQMRTAQGERVLQPGARMGMTLS